MDCLRWGFWEAFKAREVPFAPMVVLTNQKEQAVLRWPFELAYRIFERRMRWCDRWLVAGYSFGDEPVNAALRTAAGDRREGQHSPPEVLVLTKTSETEAVRHRVSRQIGIPREHIHVDGTGLPDSVEGRARARYVDLSGEGSENDRVLLSIQEAARRAGVSASTIRAWIETERVEAFRLEGDRRVYVAMD